MIPRAFATLLALIAFLPLAPAAAPACPTHLAVVSDLGNTGFGLNPDAWACEPAPWNAGSPEDRVIAPGTASIYVRFNTPVNATSLPLSLHGLGFRSDAYTLYAEGWSNGTFAYKSPHLRIPLGPLAAGKLIVSTTLPDGTVLTVDYLKPT